MKAFAMARWLAFGAAVLISVPSSAQMVIQADLAKLQPQIKRDESGFSSCGIRAIVMVDLNNSVDAYDFSMMVGAEIFAGTLKAGKTRTSKSDILKGKQSSETVLPAPIKFWIAQENQGKAVTPIKTMPSETKGFILELADIAATTEAIYALAQGERMQFAVRYKDQAVDHVISFSAPLTEAESKPLMSCFDGVIERLQATARQEKGKQ